MSRRSIHWGSAVRDIAQDRAQRAEVRFRPNAVGISANPPSVTGSWRGQSGVWYAVTVYEIADADRILGAANPAFVAFGLNPEASGALRPIRPRAFGINADPSAWLDALRRAGCTQVHIHRLATSEAEAREIAADLTVLLATSGLAA